MNNMTRYEIMKQWSDGFVAALQPLGCDENQSEHWQKGYDAGYMLRREKNKLLDEYLVGIGQKPQAVIRAI